MLRKICTFKFLPYICNPNAEIAQLVERNLAKVEVAGPSPVFRSKKDCLTDCEAVFFIIFALTKFKNKTV